VAVKIPSKKLVSSVISDILSKRKVVITLNELLYLVNKELKKQSFSYSISFNRLKKIVLLMPEIEVKTKKRLDRKRRTLKECPVCRKEIKKIFGKNVFGKRIHVGYRCGYCGYRADLNHTIPREYIFVLRK